MLIVVDVTPPLKEGPDESEERVEDERGVAGRDICDISNPWAVEMELGAMCRGFQVTTMLSLIEPV